MEINKKIENLINENEVCLFMKGTPESPQCGSQWQYLMF